MESAPPTKPRVFVVEDNEDTRFLLQHLLEQSGYDVRAAGCMHEALAEWKAFGGEVLVSDVGLPDGSGRELVRRLHESGEHPYAIAMSGYGTPRDVAASLDSGFRHHLVKPVEMGALEHLIGQAIHELRAQAS